MPLLRLWLAVRLTCHPECHLLSTMQCIRLLLGLQVLQHAYFTADMEQHMLRNYLKHFRELGVHEALATIPHVSGSQRKNWQHGPPVGNVRVLMCRPLCVQQPGWVFC